MSRPSFISVRGTLYFAFLPIALCTIPLVAKAGDIAAGKQLYADSCQSCHGDKGQGNPKIYKRMNATLVHLGSDEAQKKTDASIRKTIKDGWQKMESVDDITTDKQIDDILAFVRTLRDK